VAAYKAEDVAAMKGVVASVDAIQGETKMPRKPTVEEELKGSKPKPKPKPKLMQANDQSHKPAKHIEETARLASSVETAKDPGKVRRVKD
jgi:hypothetical protein